MNFKAFATGEKKSWLPMDKSYQTIQVCDEITLKRISGQHAMKWRIVQRWINDQDPHYPLLISDITELWLYEEQMATEQHNKAVRNTTELKWLHFYSIFLTCSLKDGTVRIDKVVRNKTGCDPEMQTGKLKTDHSPRSLLAKKCT